MVISFLNSQIFNLSSLIGINEDILKTIIIIVLNIFLSIPFKHLKNPFIRQLYSLIIGLIELIFLLEYQSIIVLFTALLTYFSIKYLKKFKPFLISVIISMTSLICIHTERFLFDYSSWKVDCSVYIMYLVMKLTYYGYQVQRNKGINQTIMMYMSYCMYFPSLLVGPSFQYSKYIDFVNLQKQYSNIKYQSKNIIKPLSLGIFSAVITAISMPIFHHQWVLQNQSYKQLPFIAKLLALNFIGFFYRIKFYTAWYLVQTAINITGLSYSINGENDSVICGSIMFQIQPNPRNKTEYWNSSVQTWLKVVAYDGICKYTKNPAIAIFGTFFVSAFWHGVHFTYYLGFIQWGILIHITKWIYKMSVILPQKFKQSNLAKILIFIIGSTGMNYLGMSVVLLEWENVLKYYQEMYYFVSFVLIVLLIVSFMVKPPKNKEKQNTIQSNIKQESKKSQ